MFTFGKHRRDHETKFHDLESKMAALHRSQAVIEFQLDGTILMANENFLSAFGYSAQDVEGRHHSMFVDRSYAQSTEYRAFWDRLNRGEFGAGKFKRIAKGEREVWIQASYNPLLDASGKPYKVIKFATDITQVENQTRELEAKMAAIGRSQAMIEFKLDGTVIWANDNFLSVMGYSASEVAGKHHSMFVEPAYARGQEYRALWESLNRGEFSSQKVLCLARGGREVWIQASYKPLIDDKGKPLKVIKFATDITAAENERRETDAQRAAKLEQQNKLVTSLGQALGEISDGNLTIRLDEAFAQEYEKLRLDFNGAIAKLREALGAAMSNASAVQSGAHELAVASDDLARRTEQQASALEETTATLNQVSSTVAATAESAKKAGTTVTDARGEAEKSGAIVQQAIDAMKQIEASSSKVTSIIGVIDEIAFQTNLLALNAGVEAARAGDAGRGFAVVASEVRALAQRSADAAKEIKSLISTSTSQVEAGSKLVTETGSALSRIVGRVNEISTLILNISSGADAQARSIGEINNAIAQMNDTTQQNAAMVEESTAAVHSLSGEATAMTKTMARFKLGAGIDVRAELEKTVPHAFKEPGKQTSRQLGASGGRLAVVGTAKRAASGGAEQNWEEF